MKVIHALICDDVRHEKDGKQTLVGVHKENRIGVNHFPFNGKLDISVRARLDEGDDNIGFKIVSEDEEGKQLTEFTKFHIGQLKATYDQMLANSNDPIIDFVIAGGYEFKRSCYFIIKSKPKGGKNWETLLKRQVSCQICAPNASQQPS